MALKEQMMILKIKSRDRSHFFKKGFSLLEVLLAMSILSFGLAGVIQAFSKSLEVLEVGQYSIDTTQLLKMKMAEIEQDILENSKFTGLMSGQFDGAFSDFKWKVSIEPVVIDDREGLNILTLSVFHKNLSRVQELVMYYADKKQDES